MASASDPRDKVVDLWADLPPDHLPPALVQAFAREDWPAVKTELRPLMDGLTTDASVHGRELLVLVRRLPIGVDSALDRYRAMVALDFGDWDAVQACLATGSTERVEIEGIRDILLAPLGRTSLPRMTSLSQKMIFGSEYLLSQQLGALKRWAHAAQDIRPINEWTRGDASVGHHARFRQLQDMFLLATGEAHSGRLPIAAGLAHEAQHLGNGWEPHRVIARDLERLVHGSMGDVEDGSPEVIDLCISPAGPSPLGTFELITYLMALIAASRKDVLGPAARIAEHAALGLASPRAHLQAEGWKLAALGPPFTVEAERAVAALLVQARHAGPGLRVVPQLLGGAASRRYEDFVHAERWARGVKNVWGQLSALVWMTALNPTFPVARRLAQLLELTGWRRLPVVPEEIAADAALGIISVGIRSPAALELAAVSGRSVVTLDLARRQIEDALAPNGAKLAAIDILATLRTTHSQELLRRLAARRDELGERAARVVVRPAAPLGLSERETEVLGLAGKGLTNREIGEKLALSQHTVARHVANARTKLGASNRAEAAARLAALAR